MKKVVHDIATGETVEVELTPEEIKEREARAAQSEAQRETEEQAQAEREALKASAKQKLISGEPLTEAEADTLVL